MRIQYCPRCSHDGFARGKSKAYLCGECGFTYFHNVASAVAGIVRVGRDILMAVRADEPEKGRLDFPGGFVDYGETLEGAMQRELNEELGVTLERPRYLFSLPNQYRYRDVTYHTLDAFFEFDLEKRIDVAAADDVASLRWLELARVPMEEIAFESMRAAVRRLRESRV